MNDVMVQRLLDYRQVTIAAARFYQQCIIAILAAAMAVTAEKNSDFEIDVMNTGGRQGGLYRISHHLSIQLLIKPVSSECIKFKMILNTRAACFQYFLSVFQLLWTVFQF